MNSIRHPQHAANIRTQPVSMVATKSIYTSIFGPTGVSNRRTLCHFNKAIRRSSHLDIAYALHNQNVAGFPKTTRVDDWFSNFRVQSEGNPRIVIRLQKTYVVKDEGYAL